ncbi:MAG: endonuclease/exonuclease/phosphatase family protein [Verrucomicrobiota bacterium]
MLVRSWNLYHGNSWPPNRRSHLEEMVRLVTADRPDVVALQEIPVWALGRLAEWSGMKVLADVAQRPQLGPVPISAGLGRMLTSAHHGRFRSAFSGQANAILLGNGHEVVTHEALTLNPAWFRREQGRLLGLDLATRLAWAKERRICQAVRLERRMVVANLHASGSLGDSRVPAAELRRAVGFTETLAREGDVVVLAGDFNCPAAHVALDGYSDPGPGIDHITVRGATPSPLVVWRDDLRRRSGLLLSDHAPVELTL